MPVLRRPVETAPFSGNVDLQFHQRKLSMSDSACSQQLRIEVAEQLVSEDLIKLNRY
jgi:hypothetical protein